MAEWFHQGTALPGATDSQSDRISCLPYAATGRLIFQAGLQVFSSGKIVLHEVIDDGPGRLRTAHQANPLTHPGGRQLASACMSHFGQFANLGKGNLSDLRL